MIGNQLLEQCLTKIEADPLHWYQGCWSGPVDIDEVPKSMLDKIEEGADAKCGTTACLAGHAMLASGKYKSVITVLEYHWDYERDEEDRSRPPIGYEVELAYPDGTVLPGQFTYVEEGAALLDLPEDLAKTIFMSTGWNSDADSAKEFVAWVRKTIAEYAEETGDEVYRTVPA